MAVLMASQTRSVLRASSTVLPGRISLAMAAEWVMPEQPMHSTRASWMVPSLTLRVSLQAPCWGAHQPTPWVKPLMSFTSFACTHLPSWGMGAAPWMGPRFTQVISSSSLEYCIESSLFIT